MLEMLLAAPVILAQVSPAAADPAGGDSATQPANGGDAAPAEAPSGAQPAPADQPPPSAQPPPPGPGYAPYPGYPPPAYPAYPPPGYGYGPYGYPPPGAQPNPGSAANQPPPPPKPEEPLRWFLRFHFGVGNRAPSDHKELLKQDGYSLNGGWLLGMDGAGMFNDVVGLGAYVGFSDVSSTPSRGGPRLGSTSYYALAQVPLLIGSRKIVFALTPRVGIGFGTLDFGGSSDTQSGAAYGLEASLFWPKLHIGFNFGAIFVPVDPPSELGRDYDLGVLSLAFMGVIDG